MNVTVKYRGTLLEYTTVSSEILNVLSVKEVLQHIKTTYGKSAEKEARRMLISVNGKSILLLNNHKTALQNGDTVSFIPICGGG